MMACFTRSVAAVKFKAAILAATLSFYAFSSAHALKADDESLVAGAKLCTQYLPRQERQDGIPEHLLAAIASTESGRYHHALGLNLPWPWTINVEGTGYFFDTKQEAVDAVKSFQSRGYSSIDVGCMQVNLIHHPNAFANLDQAFDPAYNVAYGAQFLKANFAEEGSWRKATADYHSHTPIIGDQYASLVYGAWSRIINKVADARAGRPILSASAGKARYATIVRPHSYHAVHMHDISVGRDTTRENGVLVIRPDYGTRAGGVEQASLDNFVSTPTHAEAVSPERSAIAPDGVAVVSSGEEVSHGAQIIKVTPDGAAKAKGQFEPTSHVMHAVSDDGASPAGPSVASGDGAASKNPFIFNSY